MKTKDKLIDLIKHGFNGELLSNLNEGQVSSLHKRLTESKKENNEQTQPGVTTKITSQKETSINPDALKNGVTIGNMNLKNVGGQILATQMQEENDLENDDISLTLGSEGDDNMALALSNMELSEKFASKAQEKYFWAKCSRSKGKEKEKWCKMADEFEKSTSEKQKKKMPEKLHPEKTVKYKKETKEGYLDMVGKAMNKNMSNKISDIKPGIGIKNESDLEKGIMKLVEKHLVPKMSKNDFLSILSEQGTKEKERTKEKEKTKEKDTPYKINPKPGLKPNPKAKKEETNEAGAPTIAPPKPKTPTKPSKPGTPYSPKPGPKPGPKAGRQKLPNWLSFKSIGINLK